MKLCYVTDRNALPGPSDERVHSLLKKIEAAGQTGVDWIQIREKDLQAKQLAALVGEAIRRVPSTCRILVNDRLDVAIASGAGGVHLGEQSIPAQEAKRLLREKNINTGLLVGVSVHSPESAKAAENSGADYLIFGPVFETPSKVTFGSPQGIEALAYVCASVSIPVIAIGGITANNRKECFAKGAAGVAAIRMFQDNE